MGTPKTLTSGEGLEVAMICMALFSKHFLEHVFFRFFSMLGRFWEVLGAQNGSQNRFLGGFFSMFFSSAFRHRFLMVFGRLETWKIAIFLKENNDFYKIDVFKKVSKKPRFWSRFRRPKRRKIEKKLCWNICFFWTSNLKRVFSDFCDFGSILGGPGSSKNQ